MLPSLGIRAVNSLGLLKKPGADPGLFLPTFKKNSNKKTGGKGRRYGFGNLFDFDYLINYLRKLITNIFTY